MSSAPPDRSLDLLAGRVFDIPEPQFADLVRSLEMRRLKVDHRATADAVLSRLRPRMSMARPPRRPTTQRLFCLPFEDLLYDPGTPRKAVGRIPRSAIAPIWSLFADNAAAGVVEGTAAALRAAEPDDAATILQAGAALWAEGARVLQARDAASRKSAALRTDLRDALGGEPVLASLDEVAVMLAIANPILELRATLPAAPIEGIGKDALAAVAQALQKVAAVERGWVPYVVFVLMARLRDLGSLAGVFERLIEGGFGDLVQAASAQAGEAVVSQCEDRLVDVRRELEDGDLPKAEVARALSREIDSLERSVRAVGDSGGRGLGRRIERVKAELARVAREVVVSGAGEATLAVVATFDDPLASDVQEMERLRDAEDRIVALRLCRRFSDDVGLAEQVAAAMKTIGTCLYTRGKKILGALEANDPGTSVVDLYNTVRLVELVDGAEKADRLRVAGLKAMTG